MKVEKVHDGDLHDLYFLPNFKEDEVGGACGTQNSASEYVQGFGVKTWR